MTARNPLPPRVRSRRALLRAVAGTLAIVMLAMPAMAAAAVFDPLYIISDDTWRDSNSMSQADIQAFLNAQTGVLKSYSCAEGGPNGLHSGVVKPASQIIFEASQYWGVNPKLVLATLEKEQSLISAPYHTSSVTHTYGTDYHLTNAMGAGVYSGSPDRHPGFGDQVWTGTQKLGQTTGPYAWYPGKTKEVSYNGTKITIAPLNQPTWNLYTYTPYYPQKNVWTIYNRYFEDPVGPGGLKNVYRFYNILNGSHFYTISPAERWNVSSTLGKIYRFEGVAYSVSPTSNTVPLYRFYNKSKGTHFYTASEAEKDNVVRSLSWLYKLEGPAYGVSQSTTATPVYRFYNKSNGSHFYTIDPVERDNVKRTLSRTYSFEGPVFYIAAPPSIPASPTPSP